MKKYKVHLLYLGQIPKTMDDFCKFRNCTWVDNIIFASWKNKKGQQKWKETCERLLLYFKT